MRRLIAILDFFGGWRVIRFLFAGSIGATTNFSTLYVLTEFFGVWYLVSSAIAVGVAFIVSFILQKFWTFQDHSLNRAHIQMVLHASLMLFDIALNTFVLYVLVEYAGLWYMFAQILSGGVLACLNYYVYKTYIFRRSSASVQSMPETETV